MNKLDNLNQEVTSAILMAEGLENVGSEYTLIAYKHVSLAEQRLAMELEYASVEWIVAWRGAIRAAVKSGDMERAKNLIEHIKVNFKGDQQWPSFFIEVPLQYFNRLGNTIANPATFRAVFRNQTVELDL